MTYPACLTRDEVQSWFATARESARADVLDVVARLRTLTCSHRDAGELDRFITKERSLEAGLLALHLARLQANTAPSANGDTALEAAALLRAFNAFYLADLTLKQLRGPALPPLDPVFTLTAAARAGALERTGALAELVSCAAASATDPYFVAHLARSTGCIPGLFTTVSTTVQGISVADALTATLTAAR